jgi:hypothetical protein
VIAIHEYEVRVPTRVRTGRCLHAVREPPLLDG